MLRNTVCFFFLDTFLLGTPSLFTDVSVSLISTPLFRSSAFSKERQASLCLLAVGGSRCASRGIVEPPIAGVLGVFRGEMLSRLAEVLALFGQASLEAVFSLVHSLLIHWVFSSFLPSGVAGNEHAFDILIQFVEQDVGKHG